MPETEKEYIKRLNALSDQEIQQLIAEDKCPYEPERLINKPIGMHHCPLCGEMQVAGCPHTRKLTEEDLKELERQSQEEP